MSARRYPVGILVSLAVALSGGCLPAPPGTQPDGAAWPAPACVSGTYWGLGEQGDNNMHPGVACIHCHTLLQRGPTFALAGTLYTSINEADDCDGFPGTYTAPQQHGQIEVVDATGTTFIIVANDVGNFYTTYDLRFPLQHVTVRAPSGNTIQMIEPAPHGDCNACHTRGGTNTQPNHPPAPGRIILPA